MKQMLEVKNTLIQEDDFDSFIVLKRTVLTYVVNRNEITHRILQGTSTGLSSPKATLVGIRTSQVRPDCRMLQ